MIITQEVESQVEICSGAHFRSPGVLGGVLEGVAVLWFFLVWVEYHTYLSSMHKTPQPPGENGIKFVSEGRNI